MAWTTLSRIVLSTSSAAAERVLRYLCGTYDLGRKYLNPDKLRLWGRVDPDWAGNTDTRRSHTGYLLVMNRVPISWRSRRQDSVALPSSEAEYMSASLCGQEIVYILAILRDFSD